jgi:hypothetical protein
MIVIILKSDSKCFRDSATEFPLEVEVTRFKTAFLLGHIIVSSIYLFVTRLKTNNPSLAVRRPKYEQVTVF